jgi:hypothetical protein
MHQGLDVDLFGLSETNTCWSHHHLSSDFCLFLRCYACQSKTVFGLVSPTIDRCSQNETFQAGGNLTCLIGSAIAWVCGSDILDATGLGRWSGLTLSGLDGKKLAIITAYWVCSGSPKTEPIGSSFLREYEFFCEHNFTSLNPWRPFVVDLQKVILDFPAFGHSTSLKPNANSTTDDDHIQAFIAACGLHNLHSNDLAPSLFVGASNR